MIPREFIEQLFVSTVPDAPTQQAIDRLNQEAVKRGYRAIHTHAEIYSTTSLEEIDLIRDITPEEYDLEYVIEHLAPFEIQQEPWIYEIVNDIEIDQMIMFQHVHIVTNDDKGREFTAVYRVLRDNDNIAIE
jgi:hypothetical protein